MYLLCLLWLGNGQNAANTNKNKTSDDDIEDKCETFAIDDDHRENFDRLRADLEQCTLISKQQIWRSNSIIETFLRRKSLLMRQKTLEILLLHHFRIPLLTHDRRFACNLMTMLVTPTDLVLQLNFAAAYLG